MIFSSKNHINSFSYNQSSRERERVDDRVDPFAFDEQSVNRESRAESNRVETQMQGETKNHKREMQRYISTNLSSLHQ
jgi:hypothetical protein